MKVSSYHLCIALLLLSLCVVSCAVEPEGGDSQAQGEAILKSMGEVNQYWLKGPAEEVKNYSYEFKLGDGDPKGFSITDPRKSSMSFRQGISYYSVLHKLASDPSAANINVIEESDKIIRLDFALKNSMKCGTGNGLSGSWIGYFNRGIDTGSIWLDKEKMVPVKVVAGIVEEEFSDYVKVDQSHYVPLAMKIDKEEIHFSWKFAFYEPGLWLFDMSHYQYGDGENRLVASISNVRINNMDSNQNELPVVPVAQSGESRTLKKIFSEGREKMDIVIQANKCWLLPSLQARKGLIYQYTQEEPYREMILFDEQGNIMAQLESSKDSLDKPTRQSFYLCDGTSGRCDYDDKYLKPVQIYNESHGDGKSLVQKDRNVKNLATGLNFDCAVSIMARRPEIFNAKYEVIDDQTYRLILTTSSRDAKLFTGTMLAFTSWAYMHDVKFSKSEIVCEADSHKVLTEKDYNAGGDLVGSYIFSDYLTSSACQAPGKIQAVIPHEEEGQDHSLEMQAEFEFVRPGVWLLDNCLSKFRGQDGGSVGQVEVLPVSDQSYEPIEYLLNRQQESNRLMRRICRASDDRVTVSLDSSNMLPLYVRAKWGDGVKDQLQRKAANAGEYDKPVVCVLPSEYCTDETNGLQICLNVFSNTYWEEYKTEFFVELLDSSGNTLATSTAFKNIRAEGTPSATIVPVEFAEVQGLAGLDSIAVSAAINKMTGAYHGHGIWMTFMDPN